MPKDARTYKYTPRDSTREYNAFTEEYFSGSDTTIYIDGRPIQQISGLNFSIQEQHKPIYGYASRTFDDMAVGTRIVVGTFRVPVKNKENNIELEDMVTPTVASFRANSSGSGHTARLNVIGEEVTSSNSNKPNWAESGTNYSSKIREGVRTAEGSKDSKRGIGSYEFSKDLQDVQRALLDLGYDVDINGYNDSKTYGAILDFQNNSSIIETGSLNDETRDLILEAVDSSDYKKAYTSKAMVILKSGPGKEYRSLIELPEGVSLTILNDLGKWCNVKMNNGRKGYIVKSSLEVVK